MRLNILAFVLGVGLLQQQAVLPEVAWTWGLPLIMIAVGFLRYYRSAVLIAANKILLWAFFLGVGFFWAAIFAHWRLADSLPPHWQRQDIQIIGIVANLPQSDDRSVRFQFDVEHVITEHATVPKRIALSWYINRRYDSSEIPHPAIKAGQRWRLVVRLKQPHGNANPHGFDYEVYGTT